MWGWGGLQWGGRWRTLQAQHGPLSGPPGPPALSGLGWCCCCWPDGGDQLCHDLHLQQPPPRVPPSSPLPPVFLLPPVSFCVLLLPSHLYLLTSFELRKCRCSRGGRVRELVPPPPPHLQHHPFTGSLIASGSGSDLFGLCCLWVSGPLRRLWSVAWIRHVWLLTATLSRPLPLQPGPPAPSEPRGSPIQHRRHLSLLPHHGAVARVPPRPRLPRAAPGLRLLPTPRRGWDRGPETGGGGPVVLQLRLRWTQSRGVQTADHGAGAARSVHVVSCCLLPRLNLLNILFCAPQGRFDSSTTLPPTVRTQGTNVET